MIAVTKGYLCRCWWWYKVKRKGPGSMWGAVGGRVVVAGWCRVMASGEQGIVDGSWYLLWVADNGWGWTGWEVGCGAMTGRDGWE
jgi:hypothetical protein